ncbi:hypothetical protein [Photorhabdus bodei]|uniref:Uncharacterized protein n=1 Tax=Photorhabdus bodei TaxID=2029681 RepID=A0A329WVW5_9GAMM|nr:hypothetical protein [Photorhabdus bodei]RAX08731.1 hypothetical protein CKY02_18340 [Photorhabdus bodei]
MNDIFQIFNKFIEIVNGPLPPTQNVKSILQTFTSSDFLSESSPAISFVPDEKPAFLHIDPSLGWAQVISDTLFKLIAIPLVYWRIMRIKRL